jgi:hypothetical protein
MLPYQPAMLYGLFHLFAALSLSTAAIILVPPVAKPHILLSQGMRVMFAAIAISLIASLPAVAQ